MIITPESIGLPKKFSSWRTNQEQGINSLLNSPKRSSVFCAPTGFGKSPAVVATALASKKRTIILTSTKGLMDQYLQDFSSCGMVEIRGRSNYQCELREDYTCEDGRVGRCPYWGSVSCPYSSAEMRLRVAPLGVTNYSKWFVTRKDDSPFSNFEQLICDEGHEAPEALANHMQILLHHKEIEALRLPFLDGTEADEFWNWKRWAKSAHIVCTIALEAATIKIACANPKPAWIKEYSHLINLQQRLLTLSTASPQDWIGEEIRDVGWQFDPIRPARYAELKLFCRIPRIIMVSATIRPKTMYMLGVPQERFDFFEYPSDFDASRCPTYWIPTMRNDHKQTDLSLLYLRADQIMGRRGDRKGLIHTVSWKRLEEMLACTKYSPRMIVNTKGESVTDAIDLFKASGPPAVLASPSINTGFDFAGKEAEYQILLKVPFQDGRSKIVQARQAADPEYGPYKMMQTLVQTIGRIMRSKSDRGESFIIDDNIEWARGKYGHFAPRTFHQFFRKLQVAPPPPPKL
ncbi:MAG TPA: helicase C-terminal domain-containing protein [Bacteroidia bacterium]|jgi:Rad3-related DNA helicase|nr:helicase C-terminal domain-containing protein [Bacteroidia bacterium]